MKNTKGKFIVIEGLDGSGSSTQINLIAEHLKKKGQKILITKEPTDNVIGGLIRGALTGVYHLPDTTLQLLFSADRGHHIDRVINPLVKEGVVVISDRYMWSSVAFGSIKLDRKWLLEMQKYFRIPDLTIFLKVNPETCIKRISTSRYNFELFEEKEKLKKAWQTYVWLAKKFPQKIKIVDGEESAEKVSENVLKYIDKLVK